MISCCIDIRISLRYPVSAQCTICNLFYRRKGAFVRSLELESTPNWINWYTPTQAIAFGHTRTSSQYQRICIIASVHLIYVARGRSRKCVWQKQLACRVGGEVRMPSESHNSLRCIALMANWWLLHTMRYTRTGECAAPLVLGHRAWKERKL